VPSRALLLEEIQTKFNLHKKQGIKTVAGLRKELKNTKGQDTISKDTGINVQYLNILRREIESYFPKPALLKEFNWLPKEDITKLEANGISNTAALHNAAYDTKGTTDLAKSTNVDFEILGIIIKLADLTRVQWVSPITARMLMEAVIGSPSSLAAAVPEHLYNALMQVNKGGRYYKGTIGLRDIKRLIKAAGYVSD